MSGARALLGAGWEDGKAEALGRKRRRDSHSEDEVREGRALCHWSWGQPWSRPLDLLCLVSSGSNYNCHVSMTAQ